jgi:hypothetical protein
LRFSVRADRRIRPYAGLEIEVHPSSRHDLAGALNHANNELVCAFHAARGFGLLDEAQHCADRGAIQDHRMMRSLAPCNAVGRQFDGWANDRAWVCDITYLGTGEGWLLSGRRDGSGEPSDRRLVDESSAARRSGLPSAEDGLRASQAAAGTGPAFRSRQPIG